MKKNELTLTYHFLENNNFDNLRNVLISDNVNYLDIIQPYSSYTLASVCNARFKGVITKRFINHLVCYYCVNGDLLHFHIYDYNKFVAFSNEYDKTLDIYYYDKDFVTKYDKLIRKTILKSYIIK